MGEKKEKFGGEYLNKNKEFWEAAHQGNIATIKLNIEIKGQEVNAIDADKRTALHWAAAGGHLAIVEYLIEKGAQVETFDNCGWTPLISSSSAGHGRVLNILLENGAKVNNKVPSNENSALHYAASKGHVDCVRLLIENDADVTFVNKLKETFLHRACSTGKFSVVSLLFDNFQSLIRPLVNRTNLDGETALHIVAIDGNPEFIQLLINNGAEKNIANKENLLPFDLAPDNVKYLLRPSQD